MVCKFEISGGAVSVDEQDSWLLEKKKWYVNRKGYVVRRIGNSLLYLHREILELKKGQETDHRDRNPLNNTRKNLRLATRSQNLANRRKFKNSSSRFKGVYWRKDIRKWCAQVSDGGVVVTLGFFDREEDAAKKYNQMAEKIHGNFAKLNEL